MVKKNKIQGFGVLYVYWGNGPEVDLQKSLHSVKKLGYDYHIVKLEGQRHYGDKARMYELSPFETTLFLDTDTILLDNINYGFEKANRHGLALSIAPACYARRFIKNCGDWIEYNSGVIFFRKSDRVEEVFEKWIKHAHRYPTSDQSSLTIALEDTHFNPFVLPQNYNFRSHLKVNPIFGPIKIWHSKDSLPKNIVEWNNKEKLMFGVIVASKRSTVIEKWSNVGKKGLKQRLVEFLKG